jgi:hypothetical protein
MLIVIGIPVFVMPIPLGAAMIATGTVILMKASPRARLFRRQFARRYPATNGRLMSWRMRFRRRVGFIPSSR